MSQSIRQPFEFMESESEREFYRQLNEQGKRLFCQDAILNEQRSKINCHAAEISNLHRGLNQQARCMEVLAQRSRKDKKTLTQEYLAEGNGTLCVIRCYSNGTSETVNIFNSFYGELKVFECVFEKIYREQRVFLIMGGRSLLAAGKIEKLSEAYLYRKFVEAGVSFNVQISKSRLRSLLYQFFAPGILNNASKISVFERAGWHGSKYRTAVDMNFAHLKDFPELPIFRKQFQDYAEQPDWKEYFRFFHYVQDKKVRLILSVFPVLGLLNTILKQAGFPVALILNFVLQEPLDYQLVGVFLKTFEREQNILISLDVSKGDLAESLMTSNDEVLVFDAVNSWEENYYQRKKMEERAEALISKVVTSGPRDLNVAVAILSRFRICRPDTLNILLNLEVFDRENDRLWMEYRNHEDLIQLFFSRFIQAVEQSLDEVYREIRQVLQKQENQQAKILDLLYRLANWFWEKHGIDYNHAMDLGSKPEFTDWLEEEMLDVQDLQEQLIRVVRRGMRDYHLVEVMVDVQTRADNIYYDAAYVWIPVEIFSMILSKSGLSSKKIYLLQAAKEARIIETDKMGFSRRKQIAGKRFETIQFHREALSKLGMADICELGRED